MFQPCPQKAREYATKAKSLHNRVATQSNLDWQRNPMALKYTLSSSEDFQGGQTLEERETNVRGRNQQCQTEEHTRNKAEAVKNGHTVYPTARAKS